MLAHPPHRRETAKILGGYPDPDPLAELPQHAIDDARPILSALAISDAPSPIFCLTALTRPGLPKQDAHGVRPPADQIEDALRPARGWHASSSQSSR
jgi:hypothetical protein